MKIPRNAPCPCGSGKKYKRCCGADIQPYEDSVQGMNVAQQLAQAIKASGASTIEEMNVLGQQLSAERNARPLKEFLGLSPEQMANLLYQPLASPGLVTFNEDWFPAQSTALLLFEALASGIGEEGIKATGKGNLPIQLCRDNLADIPEDIFIRPDRIRSETEFDELHTIRIVGELAGLIEHRKSRFYLTPLGQELIQVEHRAQLFHVLFNTYTSEFNWAYRDLYPDVEIIQTAWLFSLYCLSMFGQQWRPCRFYAEKFMQAFPVAINEMEEGEYYSPEQQLESCYGLRTLDRFARFWGLIEMRPLTSPKSRAFEYELQAPRLSEWLHFNC